MNQVGLSHQEVFCARVTAHPEVNAGATLNSASGAGSLKISDEQPVFQEQSVHNAKIHFLQAEIRTTIHGDG